MVTSPEELFSKSKHDKTHERPEYHETVRTADWLRGQIVKGREVTHTQNPFPGIRFTHIPSESGNRTAGFFAKRMGLEKGWSDFIFLWGPPATTAFIEMKDFGESLEIKQKDFFRSIGAMGFNYKAKCHSAEEVRDTLISWGVPYTPVPIPARKATMIEKRNFALEMYKW